MDVEILSALVNLGGQGVLLFLLAQVWAELKSANQYTRDLLTKQQEADDRGKKLEAKVQQLEDINAFKLQIKPKRDDYDN